MSTHVDVRAAVTHLERALSLLDERTACAHVLESYIDTIKQGHGLEIAESQPIPMDEDGILDANWIG